MAKREGCETYFKPKHSKDCGDREEEVEGWNNEETGNNWRLQQICVGCGYDRPNFELLPMVQENHEMD